MLPDAYREALETLDVSAMRTLAAATFPHLPIGSDSDVLASMHMARTQSDAIRMLKRAWSHRWLTERGLPSQLPDHLRQSAEQMCPRVAQAVGLSVGFSMPELRPAGELIRGAMEDVVENAFADGKTETDYLRPRMREAMMRERKALFGTLKSIRGEKV